MSGSQSLRPEDVVVGLLAEVKQRTGSHRFVADPVSVHAQFFHWRRSNESSKLFDEFIFDTRDYFPYSETLDRVLDGLQLAGYLERTNPRGTWYEITPSLESLFEKKVKPRFERSQLQVLEALADEFVRGVKTDRRVPAPAGA